MDDDLVEGITVAALAVLGVGDIAAILRAEAYLVETMLILEIEWRKNGFIPAGLLLWMFYCEARCESRRILVRCGCLLF